MAVPDNMSQPAPMVVGMPGEIDITNVGEVRALITAAFAEGATVVVADLTVTRFCDSAGLRNLLLAYHQAADAGAHLRLAVHPAGPVGRIVELTGIDRYVPIYSTLQLAIDGTRPSGWPQPGWRGYEDSSAQSTS